MKIEKGQKVSFYLDGKFVRGVVVKGGKNVVEVGVVGQYPAMVIGPVESFEPVEFDLPCEPNPDPMTAWEIRRYKEFPRAHETTPFTGEIYLKGGQELVYSFHQSGEGGSTQFYGHSNLKDGGVLADRFDKDIQAWAHACDWHDAFELADMWIYWFVHLRPVGVTAMEYIRELIKSMDPDQQVQII